MGKHRKPGFQKGHRVPEEWRMSISSKLSRKVTLSCDLCGIEFKKSPSLVRNNNYCSRNCHRLAMTGVKTNSIPVACPNCGKENLYPVSCIEQGTKFCGRKCYNEWQSRERSGENNHRWAGGSYLNGRNRRVVSRWRVSVFDRDGYTCQICGRVGVRLNAHHVRPWAQHEALRHVVDNGITLCIECHRIVHKKHVSIDEFNSRRLHV